MNIPDEATEILARNAHESYRNEVGLLHYTTTGRTIPEWDDLPEQEREDELDRWRDILGSAAPFIAVRAWDEGYDVGRNDGWHDRRDDTPNPYRQEAPNA